MRSSPADAAVLDASVAVKWHFVDEEDSDRAADILRAFEQGQLGLVAPIHIRYEVPAAITVATRGKRPRLTDAQGRRAIEEFLGLQIPVVDDETT